MASCSGSETNDNLLAKATDFLRNDFGIPDFKSEIQKKAVAKILTRKNDVVICLPNGHGRVLSYILPAAMRAGTQATIIFYSEADRAKAYCEKIEDSGVACRILDEVSIPLNNYKILDDLTNGTIRPCLLYVHVRVICKENVRFQKLFSFLLKHNRLAYVVVDEIHSRQAWLSDHFVEMYTKIGDLRRSSLKIPWIVVSSKVHGFSIETLQDLLQIKTDVCGFKMFTEPIFKPNLYYECVVDDNLATSFHHLIDFVHQQLTGPESTDELSVNNGSGLIFCKNKYISVEITTQLQKSGIKSVFYSFSLSQEEKEQIVKSFKNVSHQVLVINQFAELNVELPPNVRFIVHWGLPSSMMNYYHNTELAVREDGQITRCRIYVTKKALNYYEENSKMAKEKKKFANENEKQTQIIFCNALNMKDYCTSIKCKHAQLAEYFGDAPPKCIDKCDICVAINKGYSALKKSSARSNETAKRGNKIKSITKKLADTKF